ncbi:MAG: hypothetical protein KAQ69_00450 [Spirochaetales bacterium]|nr:hypothetical protein [Spirochaetales bacterium]
MIADNTSTQNMIEVRTYLIFSFSHYLLAIEARYISHISSVVSKGEDDLIYTLDLLFSNYDNHRSSKNPKYIHLKIGEIIQIDDLEDIFEVPSNKLFSLPKDIKTMRRSMAICNLIVLNNSITAILDPTILIQEFTKSREAS